MYNLKLERQKYKISQMQLSKLTNIKRYILTEAECGYRELTKKEIKTIRKVLNGNFEKNNKR